MKSEPSRSASRAAAPIPIAGENAIASLSPTEPAAWLSALADGDASAEQQACTHWREDGEARARWHAYHLIGDVMRSDELATLPGRDAAFLAALRERLATEPVVLAPSAALPVAPKFRGKAAWLMPAAAAAGFVVVAGVLVVARIGMPGAAVDAPQLASLQGRQAGGVQRVSQYDIDGTSARAKPAPGLMRAEGVIRDARLDEYLRAHQAARGGIAGAQPGGTMRRMEAAIPVSAER